MGLMSFIPIISTIIDKIFPDAEAANKAKLEFVQELMKSDQAQMEVNKVEAAHQSLFVAGWRPYTAWVCAFGITYSIVRPTVNVFLIHKGYPELPPLDADTMYTILFGLLGLGAYRSFDKYKLK